MTGENGFVRDFFRFFLGELGAQGAEAVEFLGGTAILALGLGLIAQEENSSVGLPNARGSMATWGKRLVGSGSGLESAKKG